MICISDTAMDKSVPGCSSSPSSCPPRLRFTTVPGGTAILSGSAFPAALIFCLLARMQLVRYRHGTVRRAAGFVKPFELTLAAPCCRRLGSLWPHLERDTPTLHADEAGCPVQDRLRACMVRQFSFLVSCTTMIEIDCLAAEFVNGRWHLLRHKILTRHRRLWPRRPGHQQAARFPWAADLQACT